MNLGISIKDTIGVGDKIQFSSLPENYFAATGKRLIDVSRCWIFDHNPYVERSVTADETIELWNHSPGGPKNWHSPVFLSNAESHAIRFKIPVILNRPRLYCHEEFPFEGRTRIILQTEGISHGKLPDEIIDHVLKKYKHMDLVHIGLGDDPGLGIPHLITPHIWDLAKEISTSRMLIAPDSGPCWIAACYPDVVIKKVRTKPTLVEFKNWVPLSIENIHAHWDDRVFQTFNTSKYDLGFTWGYKRL